MIRRTRPGSALLIVLGMVSFMVISSVAFSIYMRTSRLPSNYLRRGTSSRMLLKSALAGAIERIDGVWRADPDASSATAVGTGYIEGIYDDYYPGLNPKGGGSGRGDYPWSGNRFVNRVFAPFKNVAPPANPNEPNPSQPIPVATLTLEGLAYLPPALINDVRLQSHRTSTACWCNLAYEYGRYAFCAVDVSDCFDVNKLRANSARTSAARQRIGFSTLFADENSGLSVFNTSAMRNLDTRVNGVGNIPFVSMADFNVFFGKGEFTPFCSYVGQNGNLSILGDGDRVAANALFTTDTWFPPTNLVSGATRYDLSGAQPFSEFGDKTTTAKDALDYANSTKLGKEFIRHLGGVGTVALYDYLDADNLPTSFALPTVETAPMVCALGVDTPDGLKTTVVEDTADRRTATIPTAFVDPATGQKYNHKIVATPYKLDLGASQLMVQGQLVFPFKRLKDKDYCLKFKADVLVRIFFAPAALKSRVNLKSPLLAPPDWKDADTYVITRKIELTSGDLAWPGNMDDISKPEDAIGVFQKPVTLPAAQPRILFWKIEKYVATANGEPTTPTQSWLSLRETFKGGDTPPFFDGDGLVADFVKNKPDDAELDMFKSGTLPANVINDNDKIASGSDKYLNATDIDATKYVPHVAVWMKVANDEGPDSGEVVDVVPAYYNDDVVWGKRDPGSTFSAVCADVEPPILRFSGTTEFPCGIGAVQATQNNQGEFGWRVLYTVDPRFNFAPEAWYSAPGVSPATLYSDRGLWLNTLSGVLGKDGFDRDIFMFTSDQEYLQSMGELQFLPRLRDLAADAGGRIVQPIIDDNGNTDWKPGYQYNGGPAAIAGYLPGTWETYSAPDGDPIYSLGDPKVDVVSSVGDFRVNPFTTDERIFRAAIANTPYDWFVASTNDELNLVGRCDYGGATPRPTADNGTALSYTFSEKSVCKCAAWRDKPDDANSVYDIADELSRRLRSAAQGWDGDIRKRQNWEAVYDEVWQGVLGENEKSFFGVKLDEPLHGVDRKFLHGFWRECFGNRQQLFLIFLRAEPLTVGGSGTASMANAQTGARGVALVWRDPEPPAYRRNDRPLRSSVTSLDLWKCDNGHCPAPHRTRVLFYHQFD